MLSAPNTFLRSALEQTLLAQSWQEPREESKAATSKCLPATSIYLSLHAYISLFA